MEAVSHLKYVTAGMLYRNHIITPNKKAFSDQPGGHALYTAAGISVWDKTTGILAKVNSNFPAEWFDLLSEQGLDTRGIQIEESDADLRAFYAYDNSGKIETENPLGV